MARKKAFEDDIQIDKGVPIPNPRTGWGKYADVASKMKDGDSVVVRKEEVNRMTQQIRRNSMVATQRTISDTHMRVWASLKTAKTRR